MSTVASTSPGETQNSDRRTFFSQEVNNCRTKCRFTGDINQKEN